MSTRLRATFDRLRRSGRKALIPFLMGGDPDLETTARLIRVLADAGADIVEIGVPFSDPLADGPVIQRASSRALARGATPRDVLDMVRSVSSDVSAPVVLLSYWNPIVQYPGFVDRARRAGVSGVVVPDLPPEEANGFRHSAKSAGVATIFLASPTSSPDRLRRIARASEGFIYYVSLTGTTGVRDRLSSDWLHGVRQLKLITTKPVCVGFGISTPAQASAVARAADGVIIGSALLKTLEPFRHRRAALVRRASVMIRQFRKAV